MLITLLALLARAAIEELSNDNFASTVRSNSQQGEFSLVKFYAPWCKHCKNLAPTFDALPQSLSDINPQIKYYKIDGAAHSEVKKAHSISGYPTLLLFSPSSSSSPSWTEYPMSDTKSLEKDAIATWLRQRVQGAPRPSTKPSMESQQLSPLEALGTDLRAVQELSADFVNRLLSEDRMTVGKDLVIYFYNSENPYCQKFDFAFALAALPFAEMGDILFGRVDATKYSESSIVRSLGLPIPLQYPVVQLYSLRKNTAMYVKAYQGLRTASDLVIWLWQERSDAAIDAVGDLVRVKATARDYANADAKDKDKKVERDSSRSQAVMLLNEQIFSQVVMDPRVHVVVYFFDQSISSRTLDARIAHLARATATDIEIVVAGVNVETFPALTKRFKISSLPTVMLFKQGTVTVWQPANKTEDGEGEGAQGNYIFYPNKAYPLAIPHGDEVDMVKAVGDALGRPALTTAQQPQQASQHRSEL